jgi:hypothetical protein
LTFAIYTVLLLLHKMGVIGQKGPKFFENKIFDFALAAAIDI